LSISESQPTVAYIRRDANDRRDAWLVPPSQRYRSTTLPWRFTMYPTVHSFDRSGGVIAPADA
jgi:hypothetical protein